jgi:RNA polymerase sigma factor (sigma-70 family)
MVSVAINPSKRLEMRIFEKRTNYRRNSRNFNDPESYFKPLQDDNDFKLRRQNQTFDDYLYLVDRVLWHYRHLSQGDLNDLAQEGLLALWEALNFSENCPRAFRSRILARQIETKIKQHRLMQKRNKRAEKNLNEQGGDFATYQPETQAEAQERRLYVFKLLQTLTPRQKAIIECRYGFLGDPVPLSKIAANTEVSYETIRKDHKNLLSALAQDPDLKSFAS